MPDQLSLFDAEQTRSVLDRLISDSQLYRQSKDYKELLDFVARLPHIAPFNAMLLQIQKPGLRFAMHAKDWREKFGRYPKEGARPLLIMWPFGPVGFVFDQLDTEGDPLPEDVNAFVARGPITDEDLRKSEERLALKRMECNPVDAGDGCAGSVRILERSVDTKVSHRYRININKNHPAATRFATLIHELGHLYLGHLEADPKLRIKDRSTLTHQQEELEAESVSYIICARCSVESKAEPYIQNYVQCNDALDQIDVYEVMRAAGAIEAVLELNPKAFRGPLI